MGWTLRFQAKLVSDFLELSRTIAPHQYTEDCLHKKYRFPLSTLLKPLVSRIYITIVYVPRSQQEDGLVAVYVVS